MPTPKMTSLSEIEEMLGMMPGTLTILAGPAKPADTEKPDFDPAAWLDRNGGDLRDLCVDAYNSIPREIDVVIPAGAGLFPTPLDLIPIKLKDALELFIDMYDDHRELVTWQDHVIASFFVSITDELFAKNDAEKLDVSAEEGIRVSNIMEHDTFDAYALKIMTFLADEIGADNARAVMDVRKPTPPSVWNKPRVSG